MRFHAKKICKLFVIVVVIFVVSGSLFTLTSHSRSTTMVTRPTATTSNADNNSPNKSDVGIIIKNRSKSITGKNGWTGEVASVNSWCMIINQPGYYELNADIIGCTNETGIFINASDVVLNGMNHVVDGISTDSSKYGIYIASGVTNVTVENIKISEWSYAGIYIDGSSNNTMANCSIHDNGIGIQISDNSDNNEIVNCSIYSNGEHGIHIEGSANNTISNCAIRDNSNDGIVIWSARNNEIANCFIHNNGNGIVIGGVSENNEIADCSIYDNGGNGIVIDGGVNEIVNCSIYNNVVDGIVIDGNYNKIVNCSIHDFHWYGIIIDGCCNKIANCSIYNNDEGILIGGSNNEIVNCSIYNNDDGIIIDGNYNKIHNNNIHDSRVFAIYISSGSKGNKIYGNMGNGIGLNGYSPYDYLIINVLGARTPDAYFTTSALILSSVGITTVVVVAVSYKKYKKEKREKRVKEVLKLILEELRKVGFVSLVDVAKRYGLDSRDIYRYMSTKVSSEEKSKYQIIRKRFVFAKWKINEIFRKLSEELSVSDSPINATTESLPHFPKSIDLKTQLALLESNNELLHREYQVFLSPSNNLYHLNFVKSLYEPLSKLAEHQPVDVKKWLHHMNKVPPEDIEFIISLFKSTFKAPINDANIYITESAVRNMRDAIAAVIKEKNVAKFSEILPAAVSVDVLPDNLPQEILELENYEITASDDYSTFYTYKFIAEHVNKLSKVYTKYSLKDLSNELKINLTRLRKILEDLIVADLVKARIAEDELTFTAGVAIPSRSGVEKSLGTVTPETATLTIPGYRIKKVIGTGGFATVFEAVDSQGRTVALKVLSVSNQNVKQSFVREVSIWKTLEHPNIVKLIGFGLDPVPHLSMELMGGTLRNTLETKKKLDEKEVLRIALDIASALNYAHKEFYIVHRDIKPENILYKEGIYKLSDWGLAGIQAQISASGFKGTVAYSAPEQFDPAIGSVSQWTDVWQFGATIYELVAGEPPFGTEISRVVKGVLHDDPRRPEGISDELWTILKDLLKKKPQERPSMYEVIRRLRAQISNT